MLASDSILLPQPLECEDFRPAPLYPVVSYHFHLTLSADFFRCFMFYSFMIFFMDS